LVAVLRRLGGGIHVDFILVFDQRYRSIRLDRERRPNSAQKLARPALWLGGRAASFGSDGVRRAANIQEPAAQLSAWTVRQTNMNASSGAFLATYRPICRTAHGRSAVREFGIHPYVDGSCRREPDFESEYPTITALCRAGGFAPRLRPGHRIAFMTKKGVYGPGESHWRITSLLLVKRRFESHADAATWYVAAGHRVPRNLIVAGNPPLPLDHTDGEYPRELRNRGLDAAGIVRVWDSSYAKRSREFGVVLSCEALIRDLANPPRIYASDWEDWCGRVPGTQNPPEIAEQVWRALEALNGREHR